MKPKIFNDRKKTSTLCVVNNESKSSYYRIEMDYSWIAIKGVLY